ncbi:TIGR02300 family protein [Hyphomicrobium facile]|uniref:TIGR02300 family protein n=1 Tax=Hyphomicrobium facile TaxID=51670 RepID=A0A1I7N0C8_9HYPH|nr:TIGR02300 family protein [Hyphomicrobium facile]SFV28104.1 TIGR02300 family protein [Hyphomicrobium facile]
MSTSAAQMHAARGTKHTCSNDECGERFYDLNRDPTDCPYCGVAFDPLAVHARHTFEMEVGKRTRGKVYKLTQAEPEAEEAEVGVEAGVDVEEADDGADTPNILIEDDDSEPTTDDVIDPAHTSDET